MFFCLIFYCVGADIINDAEDEILYGPFAISEEKQMKSKTGEVIKLDRKEIKDFKSKH